MRSGDKITSAVDAVSAALDRVDPEDEREVCQWLGALHKLGGTVSDASRQRLLASGSELVAVVLRADFPES